MDNRDGWEVSTTSVPNYNEGVQATAGVPTATDELVALFFQVLGLLRARLVVAVAEIGITPQQAHALRCLDSGRPLPMRELATELGCDASTVTGLVDRLEERGLVVRQPDPDDRRVKALAVTPAGVALRDRIAAALDDEPHLLALSAEQQEQLRELLLCVVRAG